MDIKDAGVEDEAFAFQKNSDLVPIFNYHLLKMEENGVLDRIRMKWGLINPLQDIEKVTESSSFPLGLGNVFFPFFILVVGSVSSSILGLVEWVKRTIEKLRN